MDNDSQKKLLSVVSCILGTVHSALLITDEDCNILIKNHEANQFLKFWDRQRIRLLLVDLSKNLTKDQKKYQQSMHIETLLGEEKDLNFTVSSLPEQGFLVWSIQDITAEIQAKEEATFNKDKANHAEKMASVGEMAAAIVHEIRNPLTIIIGQVSLAQEYKRRGKLDEVFLDKLILRLEKSSQRINGIIKSLLNLARNTGNEPLRPSKVSEIIEEVELFASMKIKGAKVPLEIAHYDPQLIVDCHASEIIQVLINLIKNAKEEVFKQENPWVKLEIFTEQNKIYFYVTDSGHGVPPKVAKRIFEPYFTTKGRGEGTGLGLSLCQKLIETNHKGRFYLDNTCENTRFVIELPYNHNNVKSA